MISRLPNIILEWLQTLDSPSAFAAAINAFIILIQTIDWKSIAKVVSVLMLSFLLINLLFFVNEKTYEHYSKKKIRTHHLTITNNGNTPSIFLLRTIDMPKNVVLRYRVGNLPMVWVTYAPQNVEGKLPEQDQAVSSPSESAEAPDPAEDKNKLIPNLNDPMGKSKSDADMGKAVEKSTKAISNAGRKAGFFASLLGNISSLLPKRIGSIDAIQGQLKEFQQSASQLTAQVNTKVNTINTLSDQLSQLPFADQVSAAASSAGVTPDAIKQQAGDMAGNFLNGTGQGEGDTPIRIPGGESDNGSFLSKDFVYDESVWEKNIGKVDSMNGSLNFAQSKILEPGESMKVDLELMNLAENPSAVSHVYKIEVRQIMQSRLHFTAPTQYINGIVIFQKVSIADRFLPPLINVALVFGAIEIISLYCYLIF